MNESFHWQREPQAEALILSVVEKALSKCAYLNHLKAELHKGCSTGLLEWIDHVATDAISLDEAKTAGFQVMQTQQAQTILRHLSAQLPALVLKKQASPIEIGIHVDSIADFLLVRGLHRNIEGSAFSGFRRAKVNEENGVIIWVIERRGVEGMAPLSLAPADLLNYINAKEAWMTRDRASSNENKALQEVMQLAEQLAKQLGQAAAACLVLECERAYWQAHNTAGQIQKNRQDRLGMGWANHDHHTFRSSRVHFQNLVILFEYLGFICRERYYAGEEAGWGAQIMENPHARLVLFLDVDLSPGEVAIDFAHEKLPERKRLGTIGLWCALHGDSILKAGMHHLEAQFDFDALSNDLKAHGISLMDPFSNFPYLKQAFTHGEIWYVSPDKVKSLVQAGRITAEEGDKFIRLGAIGSHLENLQRKEGYKGFNQKNVSLIIKKTDPRLHNSSHSSFH